MSLTPKPSLMFKVSWLLTNKTTVWVFDLYPKNTRKRILGKEKEEDRQQKRRKDEEEEHENEKNKEKTRMLGAVSSCLHRLVNLDPLR